MEFVYFFVVVAVVVYLSKVSLSLDVRHDQSPEDSQLLVALFSLNLIHLSLSFLRY